MTVQKHDTHKYRDLTIKLKSDNWVSWKREILAVMKDRGLYKMLKGLDTAPIPVAIVPGSTPDPDKVKEEKTSLDDWDDRNNACYNQMLLTLSKEVQPMIDPTDQASAAWTLLLDHFESKDPQKISIKQMIYDNHFMKEGQTILEFTNELNELRAQLQQMGSKIEDTTHGNHILTMLPPEWKTVAGVVRQFSLDPKEVIRRLEAEEAANIAKAVAINHSAVHALAATQGRSDGQTKDAGAKGQGKAKAGSQSPCGNCGKSNHRTDQCYMPGGVNAHKAPWVLRGEKDNKNSSKNSKDSQDKNSPDTYAVRLAKIAKGLAMMARVDIPSSGRIDTFGEKQMPKAFFTIDITAEKAFRAGDNMDAWFPDSGATCHIAHDKKFFVELHKIDPIPIETANGDTFHAYEMGTVAMDFRTGDGNTIPVTLHDVLHVPESSINLISVARMTDASLAVLFLKERVALLQNEEVICLGIRLGNLYCIPSHPKPSEHAMATKMSTKDINLWHFRFAHASYDSVKKMYNQKLVTGMGLTPKIGPELCEDCPFGKQTRAPFPNEEALPGNIGDLILSDICGPFPPSLTGYKYFITWIDAKTRYASIEFLRTVDAEVVTTSFRRYAIWLHRQVGAEVKVVRTDNGGGYDSERFKTFCKDLGIIPETTAPHTHEHAGIAERYNRTIQDGALAVRHASDLSPGFWAECVQYTNFTRNRTIHARIGKTPYEAFWGRKPNVDWLRVFGSKCWALIPKDTRKKGAYKSMAGIFMGYFEDSKAYRVWNPTTRSMHKVRDIIIDEKGFIERVCIKPTPQPEDDDEDVYPPDDDTGTIEIQSVPRPEDNQDFGEINSSRIEPIEGVTTDQSSQIEKKTPDQIQIPDSPAPHDILLPDSPLTPIPDDNPNVFERGTWNNVENTTYGRGKRDTSNNPFGASKKQSAALIAELNAFANLQLPLEDFESALVVLANDEPANYKAAMKSSASGKWKEACDVEIKQLLEKGIWEVVRRPTGTNVVGNRWVFRVKRDQNHSIIKYKARLVAQGFSQQFGIDYGETFSPTLRMTTLRFLLAFITKYKLISIQCDIIGAYLNGELDEDVYMEQPEGYSKGGRDFVVKLKKGLYGLKQSGRQWYKKLVAEMKKKGFRPGNADSTVFFRMTEAGEEIAICGWYVDDGLMGANTQPVMDNMIADIQSAFEVTILGSPTSIVGIAIRFDPDGNTHISQPAFIDTIAKRLGITETRAITSPMDPNAELLRHTGPPDPEMVNISYAAAIGAINYCAVATRPDIAFAVGRLAQFSSNPTAAHWSAVKRLVRYLMTTRDLGILFKQDGVGFTGYAHGLTGYADADFAGDPDDRRSTSGWLFKLNGAAISWSSKKQHLVTRSSMESETVAGSFASAEGIWLIRLASDFGMVVRPVPLFVDNQSSIAFASNDVNHNRTKHIDIHYHYTREQITLGNIVLHYIPGIDNPADVLTKPLGPKKHGDMVRFLGMTI